MINRPYIIAEAGVNHNGNLGMAKKLVDVAKDCRADVIKFQTFSASKLVSKTAKKADYQNPDSDESQYKMLKELELSHEDFIELWKYANKRKINFLSTAFDESSLKFLVENLKMPFLKIPSGEINNGPLVLQHALTNMDIVLSTGMSSISEIKQALEVIAFGYMGTGMPSKNKFQQAYASIEGKRILQEKVTLLHCTSQYPAPIESINLNAMISMRDEFDLDVGYSDHSLGSKVSCLATGLGAKILEKHITLDNGLTGPDHKASLNPQNFEGYIDDIEATSVIMGSKIKQVSPQEEDVIKVARKSIMSSKKIKKGDIFTEDNIIIKRPGEGISPMEYWGTIGKESKRNYKEDENIID